MDIIHKDKYNIFFNHNNQFLMDGAVHFSEIQPTGPQHHMSQPYSVSQDHQQMSRTLSDQTPESGDDEENITEPMIE